MGSFPKPVLFTQTNTLCPQLAVQLAIEKKLKDNTDGAVARGVFGAPTFFVGEEMYFGQDRLDYVEDALAA